jgi:hypothetical protein
LPVFGILPWPDLEEGKQLEQATPEARGLPRGSGFDLIGTEVEIVATSWVLGHIFSLGF